MNKIPLCLFLFVPFLLACHGSQGVENQNDTRRDSHTSGKRIVSGAEQLDRLLPLLAGQRVGVVANHTSLVGNIHLVDTLLAVGVDVRAIFSPEHGFRGKADAGEILESTRDELTGLPILSLYGASKKPAKQDMEQIDWMVFDIQDVGVRFYTYTSTMHYVMEACAESEVPLLVLDRPNPNGFYVDGPVLDMQYQSFVGMHPVALVHGMTVAEYARMINQEGWLADGLVCDLHYIPCLHYTHKQHYTLPVNPSPNLKDMRAVYLYPALGLFEGTVLSVGRGTPGPFTYYGHPDFQKQDFSFTPVSTPGESMNPKFQDQICYGVDLSALPLDSLQQQQYVDLSFLKDAYAYMPDEAPFFNHFFEKLAGCSHLRQQIFDGVSLEKIRASWEPELGHFKEMRRQYLLYPDFE